MARPLRIDQEDTFYHVLNRGNERRANLRDERDREGFLTRLGQCGERHYLRNRGQPLISGEQGQGHILNYKLFVVIMG